MDARLKCFTNFLDYSYLFLQRLNAKQLHALKFAFKFCQVPIRLEFQYHIDPLWSRFKVIAITEIFNSDFPLFSKYIFICLYLVHGNFITAVTEFKSFWLLSVLQFSNCSWFWVGAFGNKRITFAKKSELCIAIGISPAMRFADIWRVDGHFNAVVVLNAQNRFPFHPVGENAEKLSSRVPIKITIATKVGRRNPKAI